MTRKTPAPKPAQRRNSGAPELKMLITAAALTATLSGWAAFASQEQATATVTASPHTSALMEQANNTSAPVDEARAPVLRSVRAPTVNAPSPVTVTQSSR